jgi:hypothetical protein
MSDKDSAKAKLVSAVEKMSDLEALKFLHCLDSVNQSDLELSSESACSASLSDISAMRA